MHRLWDIRLSLNYRPTVTSKLGFGVTQGHRKWHHSITYDFIFVFHSNCASIYYRFRGIAAYWSKIATPLYLEPPLGVKPSDLGNDPWWRKTRMMVLSGGGRFSMIRSAGLIQYTRVTDRRTDGRTELALHIRAIAYMLSRVKSINLYYIFRCFLTAADKIQYLIGQYIVI